MELDRTKKIKLGIGILALLIAGLLFAYNFGWIGGSGAVEPETEMSEQEVEEIEEQLEQSAEEWKNLPPEKKGGA